MKSNDLFDLFNNCIELVIIRTLILLCIYIIYLFVII